MKKVLVIAPYQYLPYFSGGQKSIAQFLDYLGRKSDLTVIGVADNDPLLIKSYKYSPLLKNRSFARYTDLSLVSGLVSMIRKEKYDSVVWEHPYFAWLAGMIKRRTGIKTILHIHNIEFLRFRSTGKWWWPILKWYERWFFKLADQILFVSPEDKEFAIKEWKISREKCVEVAFGVEIDEAPTDRGQSRQIVKTKHRIAEEERILLFNGLLDYKPNLDALLDILNRINPLLLSHSRFRYKIIICGKRLPRELNGLKEYEDRNIIYAGFVDDIDLYFKGADLFLNPVQSGGGIKTKMVEAIAFGTSVITTKTGAAGIHIEICGSKLIMVPDNDWVAFANAIIMNTENLDQTPLSFYKYYYWGSIVKKVINEE